MKKGVSVCDECHRKFSWVEQGGGYPGGLEWEEVECPYCGHITGQEMTSGYIATRKIEDHAGE